jgi:DNA-binding HxlR family transcriptional regulator
MSYPIYLAFKLFGRRWYPEVILEITRGATRYSELEKALPRISPRTLSARISELQKIGVIIPRHGERNTINYELTDKGKDLISLFDSIAAFSLRWHGAHVYKG